MVTGDSGRYNCVRSSQGHRRIGGSGSDHDRYRTVNEARADSSRVLVVDDDHVVEAELSLLKSRNVDVTVVHPNDLNEAHLLNTDLVLVDYRLDSWRARDDPTMPISLRPRSGVSLAAILRDHIRFLEGDQPIAIALHTAYLSDMRGSRLAPDVSRHVIANLHRLEWIFEKSDPGRIDQMAILAGAAHRIPNPWPVDDQHAMELAEQLLGIDADHQSYFHCLKDIVDCQVPLGALPFDGGGNRFMRWLLHQIMPYPTFLLDDHWVAAHLSISVDELQQVINDGQSRLAQDLEEIKYSGVLAGFLGTRWWHGKLASYIWDLLQEVGDDRHRIPEELSRRADKQLSDTASIPVVALDPITLRPERTLASDSRIVRIRLEYWPSFANPAYLRSEAIKDNPSLLALVDLLDRDQLEKYLNG